MHANMLTLNGKKMSKSTGNTISPAELFSGKNSVLDKPFNPSVVRFFILQAHYRSILDFSNDALIASEKGFYKLMDAITLAKQLKTGDTTDGFDVKVWVQSCFNAMNDDFNSPILIAKLFEAVKFINTVKEGNAVITKSDLETLQEMLHGFVFDVLGLADTNESSTSDTGDQLSGTVELLIKLRAEARANKDFATSDKIRDELLAMGIQLKDGREGTTFSLNP